MPKCDFNKVALHGCSPVNLLHIFRTPFLRTPLDGCFCIVSDIVVDYNAKETAVFFGSTSMST